MNAQILHFPDENEESREKPKMFEPKIIAGGQPPTSGNWLMDLPVGSRFTVTSKSDPKNFMCLDLEIVNKTARSVMLYELSSGQPLGGSGRVNPIRFVNQFDKLETLPSYEEMFDDLPKEETTTENNNGESNRSTDVEA